MTPLRRRMIEDMRIRNLSPQTQRAYVEQVSRFARHFGQPPERLGQDEIRTWQICLVQERRLAASSISVAVAALRFVYSVTLKRPWIVEDDIPTGRQPKKLPVVPSPEEVARFLDAVKSPKHRMILTVCYATGLRISEAVSLKAAAIDSQRMVIRVEAGIRQAFKDSGELSAVVELRRHFPGIVDNENARICARTIAGWKVLPPQPPKLTRIWRTRSSTQIIDEVMARAIQADAARAPPL